MATTNTGIDWGTLFQFFISIATPISVLMAVLLNVRESRRKDKSGSRSDLQADYDRVKADRDRLLIEVESLKEALRLVNN